MGAAWIASEEEKIVVSLNHLTLLHLTNILEGSCSSMFSVHIRKCL